VGVSADGLYTGPVYDTLACILYHGKQSGIYLLQYGLFGSRSWELTDREDK